MILDNTFSRDTLYVCVQVYKREASTVLYCLMKGVLEYLTTRRPPKFPHYPEETSFLIIAVTYFKTFPDTRYVHEAACPNFRWIPQKSRAKCTSIPTTDPAKKKNESTALLARSMPFSGREEEPPKQPVLFAFKKEKFHASSFQFFLKSRFGRDVRMCFICARSLRRMWYFVKSV